jgi:hypothetical protein
MRKARKPRPLQLALPFQLELPFGELERHCPGCGAAAGDDHWPHCPYYAAAVPVEAIAELRATEAMFDIARELGLCVHDNPTGCSCCEEESAA